MKICVATGTRAEYGLLKPLLDKIKGNKDFILEILVTGAHLSAEFGFTYRQIAEDGFIDTALVDMLMSSDSASGIVKSMGIGLIGYAEALERIKPDLIIILGDRYEMLAVATASLILKIPIAHIHGGEITEGAYDDSIRHAITKMSSLHFASTDSYRNRIIQLGENPDYVYNVGAIGLDNIQDLNLLDKKELESELGVRFRRYNYLITFHPETLSEVSSNEQFQKLLDALDSELDTLLIFTKANADTDGRVINKMIEKYVQLNSNKAVAFSSMGQLRYLSTMKIATAVVGNSSSGIIEAPSFNTPTLNIGDRQKGRIQADSVINVKCEVEDIRQALETIKIAPLKTVKNPYGSGGTAKRIMQIITGIKCKNLLPKTFFNLPINV